MDKKTKYKPSFILSAIFLLAILIFAFYQLNSVTKSSEIFENINVQTNISTANNITFKFGKF